MFPGRKTEYLGHAYTFFLSTFKSVTVTVDLKIPQIVNILVQIHVDVWITRSSKNGVAIRSLGFKLVAQN